MINHVQGDALIYRPDFADAALAAAQEYADAKGIPLTFERFCACIGIDRTQLLAYVAGTVSIPKGETEEQKEQREKWQLVIKKAYRLANADGADAMAHGVGTIGNIFLARNNFGYSNEVEVKHTQQVIFTGSDDLKE